MVLVAVVGGVTGGDRLLQAIRKSPSKLDSLVAVLRKFRRFMFVFLAAYCPS
jgi:hypothetical protein